MDDETVQVVGDDNSFQRDRAPTPRWILLALILVGVGVIWSIAIDDKSAESASAEEGLDSETDGSFAPTRKDGTWVSVGGSGETTHLRGDVALSSTIDGDDLHQTVWVLRPGGSVVRRDHVPSYSARSRELEDGLPSIVMVGDRILVLDGIRSYVLNSDLVDSQVPVGPARWIVPGAMPGVVWFVGQWSVDGVDIDWVTQVDTVDLTVGDRIDVSDVIRWPIAAIGDGLIVHPVDAETEGRYAYWSALGGLEPLALPDPYASSVLASSGSLAALVSHSEVSVLDIETGLQVAAFPVDLLNEPVRSACISPEQRFIAVVGDDGQAFVGEIDTNVADSLPKRIYGANSIGWATDDQLVYITDWEFATALNAYDVRTAQNHHIADIADQRWSLATRSTC